MTSTDPHYDAGCLTLAGTVGRQELALILDEMGRICSVAAPSDLVLGRRPDDWIGLSALDAVHPDDLAAVVAHLKLAGHRGGQTPLRIRITAGDADWMCVEARCLKLVESDGQGSVLFLLTDIDGRVAHESIRREARQALDTRPRANPAPETKDREWVVERLLPTLVDDAQPDNRVAIVVLSLLDSRVDGRQLSVRAREAVVARMARRATAHVRVDDVVARLEPTKLLVVTRGVGRLPDATAIARRLHDACTAEIDAAGARFGLATGCVLASCGDDMEAVVAFAESEAVLTRAAGRDSTAA